jgi:hypothetical protein
MAHIHELGWARQAVTVSWPFLQHEADISEDLRGKARALEDLLARETFFRELPTIEQHAHALDGIRESARGRIGAGKKVILE